ncbi:MAG TPA: VOC family protein [Terriglobales bacterium]|nr:VOC family protein [Terriglobales bacterium]
MKVTSVCAFLLVVCGVAVSANRPKITGIDHVGFYTTSPAANANFYAHVLGLASADPLEPGQSQRYIVGIQWVGYSPAPTPTSSNRMDHIALRTDDCEALRAYLAERGIKVPASLTHWNDGSLSFVVDDPEGHKIEFVQVKGHIQMTVEDGISRHMIHAGFVVRDRPAEDHFYKDILGFHLYWQGGMTADRNDWVAMQVPDGTDWLEYMLNIKPDADIHTIGVMDHISLGVKDIKQAQAKLESHGWKSNNREHAQMGRDGKWQLNVYDPDFTRVELMEFTPAQKPCCSEFTGPHPSE